MGCCDHHGEIPLTSKQVARTQCSPGDLLKSTRLIGGALDNQSSFDHLVNMVGFAEPSGCGPAKRSSKATTKGSVFGRGARGQTSSTAARPRAGLPPLAKGRHGET